MEDLHRHPDYLPARKDHNETYQKPGYAAIPGKDCGIAAEDQRPIDDSDLSKMRVTIKLESEVNLSHSARGRCRRRVWEWVLRI